jgi:ribosomal protein L37AE/L43A
MRVWGLLAKGSDRQHGGNLGYDDEIPHYYSFDSTVANGRHICVGDAVVLHDGVSVFGAAIVEALDEGEDQKDRYRCPSCRATKIKARRSRLPLYRCYGCGNEFDDPSVETLQVKTCVARYGKSWRPTVAEVDVAKIRGYFLGQAVQHSIRELRPDVLDLFSDFN